MSAVTVAEMSVNCLLSLFLSCRLDQLDTLQSCADLVNASVLTLRVVVSSRQFEMAYWQSNKPFQIVQTTLPLSTSRPTRCKVSKALQGVSELFFRNYSIAFVVFGSGQFYPFASAKELPFHFDFSGWLPRDENFQSALRRCTTHRCERFHSKSLSSSRVPKYFA